MLSIQLTAQARQLINNMVKKENFGKNGASEVILGSLSNTLLRGEYSVII